MSDEYRLFWLSPGQKAPEGSTGYMFANEGIMWTGVSGTFPTEATLGTKLSTDPDFSTTYTNRAATDEEIYAYLNPPEDEGE